MSDKKDKKKNPLKDVTGKEIDAEHLKKVTGGMLPIGASCSCKDSSAKAGRSAEEYEENHC